MSFPSNKTPQISCADFEQSFDAYVDDMLDPQMSEACSCHLAKCPPCDREVTRWQQTRILLSTAVADFATAVDVSSLRRDVEAALGFTDEDVAPRVQGGMREATLERGGEARRSGGRAARREASPVRSGRFSAVLRFASAATVSATVAAAAVLFLTPVPPATTLASATKTSTISSKSSRRSLFPTNLAGNIAPVAYAPPPLAKPEISHVEALEAAPGQRVSTWVQPRTNARVIWVQNSGAGAPIVTAGLDR